MNMIVDHLTQHGAMERGSYISPHSPKKLLIVEPHQSASSCTWPIALIRFQDSRLKASAVPTQRSGATSAHPLRRLRSRKAAKSRGREAIVKRSRLESGIIHFGLGTEFPFEPLNETFRVSAARFNLCPFGTLK